MIGVVFNPNAGRGRAARLRPLLEQSLEEAFPGNWKVCETRASGDSFELTKRLIDEGAECIASAGGDGTLSECLGALENCLLPLAVIPVGTGNDFGRQVGIRTVDDAIRALKNRRVVSVDVGVANGRPFLDTLACGFDSAVGQRVNEGFRHLKGTAAYIGAILSTLGRYEAVEVELTVDDSSWSGRAMLAAICNCQSYGGGFRVAPSASITDGLLDVVVVEQMSKPRFVSQLPKVTKGKHMTLPEVHHWRGARVSLQTRPSVRWMLDGELQDLTPVEVVVKPASRPMVATASSHGFEPL